MVAFGFLVKYLGGGRDLQMMALLEKECSLSGEDTQSLLAVKKFQLLFTLRWWGLKYFWT